MRRYRVLLILRVQEIRMVEFAEIVPWSHGHMDRQALDSQRLWIMTTIWSGHEGAQNKGCGMLQMAEPMRVCSVTPAIALLVVQVSYVVAPWGVCMVFCSVLTLTRLALMGVSIGVSCTP